MKLQRKIIGILIPVIILPLLVLGWLAYTQLISIYEEKSLDHINTLITQISGNYETRVNNTISNIELFSQSSLLVKYVLTENAEDRYSLLYRPLQRLLNSYQNSYPEYYEIRIIMPDGEEDFRQTTDNPNTNTDKESAPPVIQEMIISKQDVFTTIAINPSNNKPALYVSKRMVLNDRSIDAASKPPKLRGYLLVTVSLESLQQTIESTRLGKAGGLFITDNTGYVIFDPQNSLNNMLVNVEQNLETHSNILLPWLFNRLKTKTENLSTYKTDIDDQASFFKGIKLGEHLFLFARLPEDELQDKVAWLKNIVIAIVMTTILLTSFLIFSVIRYFILKPIQILDIAAHDIGHGKLDTPINIDRDDEMGSLAHSIREMSINLQQSDERVRYIAYHDTLTGLPNRLMFRDYLRHTIANAKRKQEKLAILFLDLDNFKWVNDTLGHHNGDIFLKEIADRLGHTMRDTDYIAQTSGDDDADNIIARLGGDEFIILLPNIADNFIPSKVAARIIENMHSPVKLGSHNFSTGASIGITIFPDDSEDLDTLIKYADLAMYHAKENGKNNYQYFATNMNESLSIRIALEKQLNEAINNNEFLLLYQPKIEIATGNIVGAEALVRWNSPEMGMIFPDQFISIAEENGMILQLGEWILNEACRQNKVWQNAGLPSITIAVNVSSVQFSGYDLANIIESALKQHQLNPKLIEIELTESIFLDNLQRTAEILESIRSLGVEIALDDFGTGYSSLAYLRKLLIDNLKIDRSFINEIANSEDGEAVITAIISMAHAMRLKVTAEGVEDIHQLTFLREQQCDYVQGYYFYKPLAADDLGELLKQQKIKTKKEA
ncbi:MAG TPA: EAL domain-containing protein [Gammaproteobacteria bacterium]